MLSAVTGFPDDALPNTGLLLRRLWERNEGDVPDDLVRLPVNDPRDRVARHPIAARCWRMAMTCWRVRVCPVLLMQTMIADL